MLRPKSACVNKKIFKGQAGFLEKKAHVFNKVVGWVAERAARMGGRGAIVKNDSGTGRVTLYFGTNG